MSEFRVDRPGRYRTREGKIAVVTTTYNSQGGTYIAFTGDGANCWTEKGEWAPGIKCEGDLIAYLGPLEESPKQAKHDADITARADAIMADVRAQCQTLRRSLGQRFRHIAADDRERFAALYGRYGNWDWWRNG